MSVAATEEQAVAIPRSRAEAISSFGDGSGVTVMGGGTILMPQFTAGGAPFQRVLLLARAGLDEIVEEDGKLRIGATVRIAQLVDAPEPLGSAALGVGDAEIRAQATVGGNLCATSGPGYPRGDLQAPLIALGATIRSAGAGGERTEPVEDFLAGDPASRLVLEVELDSGRRGAWAALERPHAHSYTALSVAASVAADGSGLRVAASGVGPHAVRLSAAESGGLEGEPSRALQDVTLVDDALASAWYREKMLPVLVRRALSRLKEAA